MERSMRPAGLGGILGGSSREGVETVGSAACGAEAWDRAGRCGMVGGADIVDDWLQLLRGVD